MAPRMTPTRSALVRANPSACHRTRSSGARGPPCRPIAVAGDASSTTTRGAGQVNPDHGRPQAAPRRRRSRPGSGIRRSAALSALGVDGHRALGCRAVDSHREVGERAGEDDGLRGCGRRCSGNPPQLRRRVSGPGMAHRPDLAPTPRRRWPARPPTRAARRRPHRPAARASPTRQWRLPASPISRDRRAAPRHEARAGRRRR